jgi:hypothetical protein
MLSCLATVVGDGIACNVRLSQIGHIDKGDTTGTETEKEQVAGKLQLADVLVQFLADSLAAVVSKYRLYVECDKATDNIGIDSPFLGLVHTAIGDGERVACGKSFAHSLVPYRTEGTEVAAGGVATDAPTLQKVLEVVQQLWGHLLEGYVFLADGMKILFKAAIGTDVVVGNADASVGLQMLGLTDGVIQKINFLFTHFHK